MKVLKAMLQGFMYVEKAFWKRAIFKKPLMPVFITGMLLLFFVQAIPLYDSLGPLVWWWGAAVVLFSYLVAMPMLFYLIDPDLFFPGTRKRMAEYKEGKRLKVLKGKNVDGEFR